MVGLVLRQVVRLISVEVLSIDASRVGIVRNGFSELFGIKAGCSRVQLSVLCSFERLLETDDVKHKLSLLVVDLVVGCILISLHFGSVLHDVLYGPTMVRLDDVISLHENISAAHIAAREDLHTLLVKLRALRIC